MMLCGNCGVKFEESNIFCVKCGKQKSESQIVIKEKEQIKLFR
jgi:uncharacterized membrane protein YvbJ